MPSLFYSFSAVSLSGEVINMADLQGKVVLIVNTASKCGFTPQYAGLQELHQKYSDKGLVICGFPCNQFGKQEPGDNKQIQEGCLINYGVSFQMFEKIKVNGKQAHPLFAYLKKQLPDFLGGRIKWNFTKFLLDKNGTPVKRFAPWTTPQKMELQILKLLSL